uniref:Uncharacterized protein n=1 Tax=Triticum urartu TaxID=4572 RepID=A0A8R7JZB8_TRIUA
SWEELILVKLGFYVHGEFCKHHRFVQPRGKEACVNRFPQCHPSDNDVLCSLLLGMATRSATVQSPHGPSVRSLIPFCLAYMSASMWRER